MRVTLFHNPTAGKEETTKVELLHHLNQAGHQVTYQSTDEDDFQKALDNPGDWIIMAGGDGTVGKILPEAVGSQARFGLLPSGTANNIARTLNIQGACQAAIKNWSTSGTRPFRVGRAEGAWGEKKFVEAVGWGLFPRLLEEISHRKKEKDLSFENRQEELSYAIRVLTEIAADYSSSHYQITIDGEDLSGEYLLVEVMNIKSLGPNLDLAPTADPGDELLDLVLVAEKERDLFRQYLQQLLEGKETELDIPVRQGKEVHVEWNGPGGHLDDETMENEGSVTLKLMDPPFAFLTLDKE